MNATSVALAMASTSRAVFASSPSPVDGTDFFCAFAPETEVIGLEQSLNNEAVFDSIPIVLLDFECTAIASNDWPAGNAEASWMVVGDRVFGHLSSP
jgi:hypothetical protein